MYDETNIFDWPSFICGLMIGYLIGFFVATFVHTIIYVD